MVSVGAVAGVMVLLCFVMGMMCIFIKKSPRRTSGSARTEASPSRTYVGQGQELQEQVQEQSLPAEEAGAEAPAGQQERGLEQEVMERLPLYQLPHALFHHHAQSVRNGEACPICLSPLLEGHFVRVLPPCCHTFHLPCIDQWFLTHSNCPLCRMGITFPHPL
ncbi:hypothetical protein L7F22_028534 [Adiantum nelumboides]|nr:hypothetical protein [Adiantum nelumboides]